MSEIINLKNNDKLNVFIEAAKAGAVFAYPTEAVYGLGCNINNKDSIKKILKIKKRDVSKGLIIISDNLEKVRELIDDNYFKLFVENNSDAISTTWLCPASNNILDEITGGNKKVGIRITKHEVSRTLCKCLEFPIISTSANISGQKPITNFSDCVSVFGEKVDYIIEGNIGENKKPSRIVDLLSKEILREGG